MATPYRFKSGQRHHTCGEQFAHRGFFFYSGGPPALIPGIYFVNVPSVDRAAPKTRTSHCGVRVVLYLRINWVSFYRRFSKHSKMRFAPFLQKNRLPVFVQVLNGRRRQAVKPVIRSASSNWLIQTYRSHAAYRRSKPFR